MTYKNMQLANKISPTVFAYQVIGQGLNVLYDKRNRSIIISDAKTGAPQKIIECEDDLDFEDFTFMAKDFHLTLIEFSN